MKTLFPILIFGLLLFSCKKDKVISTTLPFIAPESFQSINACNLNGPVVNDINFLNEQFAIKTTTDNYQITNDGGNTWISKSLPELVGLNSFIRSKDDFYLYGYRLFNTQDGGDHFDTLNSNITRDLIFLSKTVGVKTANDIFRTTDGGYTWVKTYTTTGPNAHKLEFPNSSIGYANVSFDGAIPHGLIIKTIDGGITWQEVLPDIGKAIYGLSFVDTKTGYFTTIDGDLYKTKDGGNNWSIISNLLSINFGYVDIEFVTESQGYLWNGQDTKVYLTKDSGATWKLVADTGCDNIKNVQRIGNTVFINGSFGTLLKSK